MVRLSKLQTGIALSTTEAEYIALFQVMRDQIPLMNILSEIEMIFPIQKHKSKVKCALFEDNTSFITFSKAPKMTPRNKYIFLKYHHFRSFATSGAIDIQYVNTKKQVADIFTKPVSVDVFLYLRTKLCGLLSSIIAG